MPNRFVRRIRDGDIPSIESLKAEFKALAKESHPDLAGPGGMEEFIRVRTEYEAALRNFERHRFGTRGGPVPPAAGRSGGAEARTGNAAGHPAANPDATPAGAAGRGMRGGEASVDAAFFCLHVLRKRGFPKTPRHAQEELRYEYARRRFLAALEELDPDAPGFLVDFERAISVAGEKSRDETGRIVRILDDLLEYADARLPAMRTSIVLDLGRIERIPSSGEALPFLRFLASLLGVGPTLAGGTETGRR